MTMGKRNNKSGVQLIITPASNAVSNAPVTPTVITPNFHANLYKKWGRPRSFTDVMVMMQEIDEYFDDATLNKAHPNKAGLALWLGVAKSTLQDYADGKYDDAVNDFSAAIKRAYSQIEQHWIGLLGRPTPNVGAIFYMKNALGYRDVVENPGGGNTVNFVLAPEIADKYQLVPKTPDAPTPLPPEDVKVINDEPAPQAEASSIGQTPIPSS